MEAQTRGVVLVVDEDEAAVRLLRGQRTEVDILVAFQQRVALHDFVVKVRQRLGDVLVDHEREPESQAGNVHGAAVEVHAVDVLLEDLFLDLGVRLGSAFLHLVFEGDAAEVEFAQEPHGEGSGADGGVADLDRTEAIGHLLTAGVRLAETIVVLGADEFVDRFSHAFVRHVGLQVGREGAAAHVLDDLLGGVEGALLLVVLQEALEDAAQHFRVYAHLRVVRVVLVDGEVVLFEEGEEFLE